MDGRPHPPAWAPHTFRGFSTGRFVGNALVVRTTHMKNGALRRGNGVPQSDQATLTEFFVRHDDHLTNVTVVTDPVFLSEPMVRSNDFYRQPVDPGAWLYACDDGEQILDRAKDDVPHYLFGKQPFAREFAARYKLPLAASLLGGRDDVPRTGDAARDSHRCRSSRLVRSHSAAAHLKRARAWTPSRTMATFTSGQSATTFTCWSATAATSSCRQAIKARSWSIPAKARCQRKSSPQFER